MSVFIKVMKNQDSRIQCDFCEEKPATIHAAAGRYIVHSQFYCADCYKLEWWAFAVKFDDCGEVLSES